MRVNGYGVRPGNNGYSGQQSAGDEYNRSFKQIRFTSAEEYATRGVKEYHHYPEQKDLTKEDDDDKQQQQNSSQNSSRNAKNSGRSGLQAIQQVVVAIAGSAVVATSYTTAMAAKRARKEVEDPSSSVVQTTEKPQDILDIAASWEWSEDNTQAFLVLTDSAGNVVAKISAEITTVEQAAGCNTLGKRIFTASAASEGTTYTDEREEELPALGHDFDEGTEVALDNGQTAMDFECQRCGEHFVIQNSLDEE